MKHLFWFVLLALAAPAWGQVRHNYKWVMQQGQVLDFNQEPPEFSVINSPPFRNCISSISDEAGNLLFFMNGCQIQNSQFQMMENGDSLNSAHAFSISCKNLSYPPQQSCTIVPFPKHKDRYVAFNQLLGNQPGASTELLIAPSVLYYHIVDMSENGGLGKVVVKKQIAIQDSFLNTGSLSATSNQDRSKWWIVQPKVNSNCYFIAEVDSSGVKPPKKQCIGPVFLGDENRTWQVSFSPDRNKYALAARHKGIVLLMDFDSENGVFSNPRTLPFPYSVYNNNPSSGGAAGVCFSGDSHMLYVGVADRLYQYDISTPNPLLTEELIDTYYPIVNPYGAFLLMTLGADGRIYISGGAPHKYASVINRPNCRGALCDFQRHTLYMPNSHTGEFNNIPHFDPPVRQYDCQPLGANGPYAGDGPRLLAHPNPARESLWITAAEAGRLQILRPDGRICREERLQAGAQTLALQLPAGLYLLRYISDQGAVNVQKLTIAH